MLFSYGEKRNSPLLKVINGKRGAPLYEAVIETKSPSFSDQEGIS